jgi:RimJ/RimL family protein N-acetyltransferase
VTARAAANRRVGVRRTALVRRLRDVDEVREQLESARAYAAYALAYLDQRLFHLAEFHEAVSGDHRGLVMHARGGLGPSTLTMGDPALVQTLLGLHAGPQQAFFTCEVEHVERILSSHNLWRPQTMLRMELDKAEFNPPADLAVARRLTAADAAELNRLYNEEGTRHTGRQIEEGVYFGSYHRSWLVAAAGTHIYSREEGTAVVGNVYTHPDFRNHGLGTAVTAAVVSHLMRSCDLIVLNVDPANRTARHIYEQMGFKQTGRLIEAMATRRGAFSPLPIMRRLLARHRSETPGTGLVEL